MCKPQKVLSQKTEIKDNFKNLSFFRWGGGLLWTASHNNIYHKNGLFLKKINTKGGGGGLRGHRISRAGSLRKNKWKLPGAIQLKKNCNFQHQEKGWSRQNHVEFHGSWFLTSTSSPHPAPSPNASPPPPHSVWFFFWNSLFTDNCFNFIAE